MEFTRRDKQLQDAKQMRLKKTKKKKGSLHIVYVMTWTGICGGSKIIFEHCNRLLERGHQVTIVCHFPKPDWFPLKEEVNYIQPEFTQVLGESIPPCDVIVVTYWKEIYECMEQALAPVVYFEQGDTHLFAPEEMDELLLTHIRKQIQLAPFVYTVSDYAAQKLMEQYTVTAKVIPNAVSKQIFYPCSEKGTKAKNEKVVICTIGADYLGFKRVANIITAVEQLKKMDYNIEFIWISPGTSNLNTTEAAIVCPSQNEIGDYLRSSDIYVCASLYESFCLPVLEAMTCGVAVVTTDCGGVRDYICDGENALIVETDNVTDLTQKLAYLIEHEEVRKSIREKALETAQQFDWEVTTNQLEHYYRKIAGYKIKADKSGSDQKQLKKGITISLCMIVKDEEAVLARCLDSVKEAVDEIIIVDTGSTDTTKKIAKKYTDKVYDFEWIDDFSAARNYSFSKATMDYQMWLDADDILSEEMLQQLIKLKEDLDPNTDIVMMKYVTNFDDKGRPIHISTRERLLRREKGYIWNGVVHECIAVVGNAIISEVVVYHHKIGLKEGQQDRNLKIYEALEKSGKPFDARQQYYFARELREHNQLIKAAYYFERFLIEQHGWVEDNISTCFHLATIYNSLGEQNKVLPILFKSFEYAPPRAEICCEIGYYYKRASDFRSALHWFRIAADLVMSHTSGFILVDYWGYIPNIETCVCYFELGDYVNALKYNEAAAVFKPDNAAVEINRNVLKEVMS
jgi:glycosyltransferase involved in cell wall biosynthesis